MYWKIGLASVAALVLGAGLTLAGQGGGMTGMSYEQRATAPTTAPSTAPATQAAKVYTCSMHPEVTSDKPGKCPKCGMNLQLKQENIQPKRDGKGQDSGNEHKH